MVLDAFTMRDDNDELPFITLAAATANVTRYLEGRRNVDEQKDATSNNGTNPTEGDAKNVNQQLAFVERRLRELAEWERRIREDRLRYKKWK